jgi:predicted transposase/invertase (TIGR01784 family)
LQDIRKSKVWQEAHETGIEKGESRVKKDIVKKGLAKGMSVKEIAEFMEVPVKEVRRLAKDAAK